MISEKTRRWIEIGKIFSENKDAEVICPECQKDYIKVEDVFIKSLGRVVERIVFCPNCNAKIFIRL